VTMSATPVMVSIGDTGVLNREVSHPLSEIWIDRDLGWLDFNDRVLAEALDQRTPLLERAKFLAIFTSNLDEFVMKRVSVLRHGTSPGRANLLAQIRERLLDSLRRQADCFRHQLVPELAAHGIHLRKWDDLTPAQQDAAGRYFDDEISPALTPLVFDPAHAFPFLSNLSISLAFLLHDPRKETSSYARVKIPAVLKQWIRVEMDVPRGEHVFVPLYDVIRGNIHKLYAGMKLTGTSLFRLTRDADVEIDDDSDEAIEEVVARNKSAAALRACGAARVCGQAPIRPFARCCARGSEARTSDVYDLRTRWTTRLCSRSPHCRWRHCATLPGLRFLWRPSKIATTSLLRYAWATFWSIIRTKVSRIALSDSSLQRLQIPKPWL
jgi:hypothetical protein